MQHSNLPSIVADENIPQVKNAFADVGLVTTLPGREISSAELKNADILLVRSVTKVNRQLLHGTPVRFVASATAGFNHVDVDYLKSAGIGFARAPGSNAMSAAQYVIAALCYWSQHTSRALRGLSLGVVGVGNVGSRVAKMATQLGMRCVLNDPPRQAQGASGLSPLDDALGCDAVTCHVPYSTTGTYATENLLNADRIRALAAGTLLINASRGEVIEEPALLTRMQSHNDLSLVLDVWANEPNIDPEMMRHCLLATPHIAGYSSDGKLRGTQMILNATCEYLGIRPRWQAEQVKWPEHPAADIDVDEKVVSSVLSAYDIAMDSRQLLAGVPAGETLGTYFDQLRKSYPIRREFVLHGNGEN